MVRPFIFWWFFLVRTDATVKRWGNSLGIIIPKEAARKLGLKEGERIDVDFLPKKRIDGFGMSKGIGPFERDHDDHEF